MESRVGSFSALFFHGAFLAVVHAQTTTFIPANEAAAYVGEYATVEVVAAKVFTSKNGNTFLNIGAAYPNQTFTGWIPPASPVNKSPLLSGIEHRGRARQNHWPDRDVQRKAGTRINVAEEIEVE